MKGSFSIFDKTFYKQSNGMTMRSTLGPTLANSFLSCHETRRLRKCQTEFKPVFYRRT